MQETYSPEVRSAVLSTIQHPNYAKLAEFLMDGLTRDEIKEKVGFDDTQIDSMIAHIANFKTDVPAEEAKVASPEVVSSSEATNIPVEGSQTGVGQIQANVTAGDMKEAVVSTGNDAPTTTAPVADVLNAPVVDNGDTNTSSEAKTEELSA